MTDRTTRPFCGNDPRARLTDGDRQAVADFRAYLAARAALRAETLLEAADLLQAWRPESFERWAVAEQDRYEDGINDATNHLRRLAGAQPQPDCGTTQRPAGLTVPALARLLAGGAALAGGAPPYDQLPDADRERYLTQARQLLARGDGGQQP
ncbi:hypothetical protein [Streptomyces sp. NPDC049590]|uniref:hypothetical protein n=1 Tax=Streptomyces sp. NPDC049590 TaxID=3154834 RepID=UPI003439AAEA